MSATNEKPLPNKSTNITLANAVGELGLSTVVMSGLRVVGPIPAKLMNCADDPGDPTTTTKG